MPPMPKCQQLLVFVAGFHHSGTTLVQHMALRYLGANITTRHAERWPSACNPDPVLKHPTNTPADVQRLRAIRAHVVYVQRDGPNTIWSIMKRRNMPNTTASVSAVGRGMCAVHCEWRRTAPSLRSQEHIFLHSFTRLRELPLRTTNALRQGARRRLLSDDAEEDRVAEDSAELPAGLPTSKKHEQRRAWQAKQPIYADDWNVCFREAPSHLWYALEAFHDCACSRAR